MTHLNADFRRPKLDDNFCVKASVIPAFLRFVRQFCHRTIDAASVVLRFPFRGLGVAKTPVFLVFTRFHAKLMLKRFAIG